MIASGILFKAEFDMSKYDDTEVLKQFNPSKFSSTIEEIQATPTSKVQKETTIGDTMKIVSYKSNDEFILNQILESSIYMENAAPKLIKIVTINPKYFLVAFPYYRTSCEDMEDFEDLLTDEDEDKIELSDKIEDTVKELARVTMYFVSNYNDPKIIQEKITKYVDLCFKFAESDVEPLNMDDLAKSLENQLQTLLKEENEKKNKGNDDNNQ